MKKLFALLTVLLVFTSSAMAAEDLTGYAIANGTVTAVRFLDVTAPYSGTLGTFDLAAGDRVTAGDELFSMLLTTVYAPEAGTVTLFAAQGDDATGVMSHYGALASLETAIPTQIVASTANAYNTKENHILYVGETLYFRSSGSAREEGWGKVIRVDGSSYVVDILEGDFDIGESFNLYRNNRYESRDNVGRGTVTRRNPVSLTGVGRIYELLAADGTKVEANAPVMTLMSADAEPGASPIITAPQDAVVAMVTVSPGQQVWKGQMLARLYLTDELEVVAEADEIDLHGLRVGDRLPITLDTDEATVLYGTVTEISALGVTRQNAAYYTVHVSLQDTRNALLGASASVYLPKE
ncbi:MAG: HlyD family efflux transporter periplasmic adaptor subunit [Christensenellaceae bacterium]|nr:HlyD family efflux transporter periplasmic adaptor subunit [Christensenellaceae bacterium]